MRRTWQNCRLLDFGTCGVSTLCSSRYGDYGALAAWCPEYVRRLQDPNCTACASGALQDCARVLAASQPNEACAAVELVSPCITFDGQQPEVTAECAGKHPIQ